MVNAVVLLRNTNGELVDAQGNRYNEQYQRLDAAGNVVQELAQVEGAANRTLAEINRPDEFYANRSAFRLPAVERNDFEVKPQYYTQVGQKVFYGLPTDNPMDHLERFEDFVGGIKANGVSQDYLFCKLFPHSLDGEALNWLNTLPAQSLSTWEQTRKAFLNNFYDDARSEELRTKISSFKQGPTEAFKTCWMRFNKLQRDCPHHGFSDLQLISTFYKGIDWRYQVGLDSASNGNFMTRNAESAYELIKNLSQSHSTLRSDMERASQNVNDPGQLSNVQASLNSIQNLLLGKNQKHVHFAAVEGQEDAEVNYIGGQQFQRGFSSNQPYRQNQGGYNRTYGNNDYKSPPQENNEIKGMLEQLLEGQQKLTVDFNKKLDDQYLDINSRLESVHIHLRKLDQQVAQTAEAVKRQEGFLPGKTDSNPRHVNAVYSEEGRDQGQKSSYLVKQHLDEVKNEEVDDLWEETSIGVGRRTPSVGRRELEIDEQNSMSVGRRTPSVGRRHLTPEPDLSNNVSSPSLSHPTSTVLASEPQKQPEPVLEHVYKSTEPEAMEHVYTPIPSFPHCEEIYNAIVEQIGMDVPDVHKCKDLPGVKQTLNKVYHDELSLDDAVNLIHAQCAAILEREGPKKVADPGCFLLNCEIKGQKFDGVLCDSGSSVNVIPLSTAKGLGELQPYPWKITFADLSVKNAAGKLIDVPVEIGGHKILTDFVVMELDKEPKEPFILGRGFLATAGAVIDFKYGLIHLHLPGEILKFKMDRGIESTLDDQQYHINTVSVVTHEKKMPDSREEKEKVVDQPQLSTTPSNPATAIQQKVPAVMPSPSKPRYVSSKPKAKHKSNHVNAGRRVIPPIAGSRPGSVPTFLGCPHAPTAYTPPWMLRTSKRHSLPLSDPPDI